MAENTYKTEDPTSVNNMFSSIAKTYDLTNTILSCGNNILWNKILESEVNTADSALDVATGTGILLPMLAKYHNSVVGLDICEEMLLQGQKDRESKVDPKLWNKITWLHKDALNTELPSESFDTITVAYGVRNFCNLEQGLKELYRVLKPNGKIIILEFGQPSSNIVRGFFNFYSKYVMPNIGGLISGNKEAYEYLPKTSALFPCGNDFTKEMKKIGFNNNTLKSLSFGIAWLYTATKS